MPGSGSTVLDFGAFPGTDVATVAVTGQTGIVSGSLVDCQLRITGTATHSEDEHAMLRGSDDVQVTVKRSSIVAGTGFSITGMCHNKSKMWGTLNVDWEWV